MKAFCFSNTLLSWYEKHKRDLPWRKNRDPYSIWISEIMLQQTQVQTVIPYFQRWMKMFPDIQTLANASLDEVLKAWEGLGYYGRARNLHRAADFLVRNRNGLIPDNEKDLLKLPGIGKYTSGAVLSIAFNQKKPVLDGNVIRVLSRIHAIRKKINKKGTKDALWKLAGVLLPEENPGEFNQALMELGAIICRSSQPLCMRCPVRKGCKAYRLKSVYSFPVMDKNNPPQKISTAVGIIWKGEKIFIQQRPLHGLMGGLWEFPGGKLEKKETPEQALSRELKEELGIKVRIFKKRQVIRHAYTRFQVKLHPFDCTILSGHVRLSHAVRHKWVTPEELKQYAFPAANVKLIRDMLKTPLV
ncbi:MAG: A/G-specific adenine glycosylase [Candidatus Aureabacteria bacterium]|nr:A/G-specific adenine glycosylase [Candidatus Auribacterota bacterium]